LRDIRTDLDAAGRSRGRPILLALKTPDSPGYCHELGLDLERWMTEGLVDLYVPGGYFQLNPWPESVALARRHGVKVYACLPESRVREATAAKERASLESLRARALAAWAAGADGIEMFNHFDPTSPLWRELGDPALLRPLPKTYFASVQGASNSRGYYPAGAHFTLPKLTPDAPEKLSAGAMTTQELFIGDDLRTTPGLRAKLCVRVESTAGAKPTVQWDGAPVTLTAVDGGMFTAPVENRRVTPGAHRITVTASGALRLDDLLLRLERQ
ncbi:MAG: hypothetical protein NTV51_14910, partial [Verrucomicrobia bacterium]|nr:hypothetical protein [Verrucomicrobiota bacterium]